MKKNKYNREELSRGCIVVVLSIVFIFLGIYIFDIGKFTIPIVIILSTIVAYKLVYWLWKPKPIANNETEDKSSPYTNYIFDQSKGFDEKTVSTTEGGSSGFVLFFTDETWAMCYLSNQQMDIKFGNGVLTDQEKELINEPEATDCSKPVDRRWKEFEKSNLKRVGYDINSELRQIHEKTIRRISVPVKGGGMQIDNTFSIRFTEKIYLDTYLIPQKNGRIAVRVFCEEVYGI